MIAWLELEATPRLKEYFMKNWLVNLDGEAGRWIERDLMQEHYNKDLEEAIDRKGQDFGGRFIREVVSRSVQHCGRIKKSMRMGVGLKKKGWKHTEPHSHPEIVTLLKLYREEELHLFQQGRRYSMTRRTVDDYARGKDNLANGKLQKWIEDGILAKGAMAYIKKVKNPAEELEDVDEVDEELDETNNTREEVEDGSEDVVLKMSEGM
jgi:hypothetical protein